MSTRRPKPRAHHSSLFHRIHQRHEARHHPDRNRAPEERPLLQEEHPDSTSEPENDVVEADGAPTENQGHWTHCKNALLQFKASAIEQVKQVGQSAYLATAGGASRLAQRGGHVYRLTKRYVTKLGAAVSRNLKLILLLLCMILAAISIGEALELYRRYRIPAAVDVCTSSDCVHAANTILDSLHPQHIDMNPCDDFDDFVCGGFNPYLYLDGNETEVSRETIRVDGVRRYLYDFLHQDESLVRKDEHNIFKKAKNAYDACQNQQKLREFGIKPLKASIDEIKLLFSRANGAVRKGDHFQTVVDSSNDRNHILTMPFLLMLKMGVEEFLSFKVKPDSRTRQHSIFVGPADLTGLMLTDAEAFDKHGMVQEYERIIEHVLGEFMDTNNNKSMLLHRNGKSEPSARDLARGVVHLESRLNTIRPSDHDLRNMTRSYHITTFQEFEQMMPYLAVGSIIQDLAPHDYNGTTLIVSSPRYVKKLSSTLSATSIEVLQAFCIWKIVQIHADHVEHDSLRQWKTFSIKLGKRYLPTDDERWHACIDSVDEDLGLILLRFFCQDHLCPQMKDRGAIISHQVQSEIIQRGAAKTWLTKQERVILQDVVKSIDIEVAYPVRNPNLMSLPAVDEYYDRVITTNGTYFDNKISAARNKLYHQWSQLGSPDKNGPWQTASVLMGANHDGPHGQVLLPAPIMRNSYVNEALPPYLAYSSFGVSAASQIIQVFSYQMTNGVANGSEWMSWSSHTQASIETKESCFRDQCRRALSSSDSDVELDSGGNCPLSEGIAEAGAVRAAYSAWMRVADDHELRLPGLQNFTSTQLFWLSYGSSQCSAKNAGHSSSHLTDAWRSLRSFQIKATAANSREFKHAFNCATKDPVCELW